MNKIHRHQRRDSSPSEKKASLEKFFTSSSLQKSFSTVETALAEGVPLVMVTGGEGSGKTFFCHKLAGMNKDSRRVVFFPRTVNSFTEAVKAIAENLGVAVEVEGKKHSVANLQNGIRDFLVKEQLSLLVIFDNAEEIYLATLERIRKMLDHFLDEEACLHLLFSGRPSFLGNYEQLSICNFNTADEIFIEIEPLTEEETALYLTTIFMAIDSGEGESFFTEQLVKNIFDLAGGNFRKTCILAEKVLKNKGENLPFKTLLDNLDKELAFEDTGDVSSRGSGLLKKWRKTLPWLGGAIILFFSVVIFLNRGGEQPEVIVEEGGVPEISVPGGEKQTSSPQGNEASVSEVQLPPPVPLAEPDPEPEPEISPAASRVDDPPILQTDEKNSAAESVSEGTAAVILPAEITSGQTPEAAVQPLPVADSGRGTESETGAGGEPERVPEVSAEETFEIVVEQSSIESGVVSQGGNEAEAEPVTTDVSISASVTESQTVDEALVPESPESTVEALPEIVAEIEPEVEPVITLDPETESEAEAETMAGEETGAESQIVNQAVPQPVSQIEAETVVPVDPEVEIIVEPAVEAAIQPSTEAPGEEKTAPGAPAESPETASVDPDLLKEDLPGENDPGDGAGAELPEEAIAELRPDIFIKVRPGAALKLPPLPFPEVKKYQPEQRMTPVAGEPVSMSPEQLYRKRVVAGNGWQNGRMDQLFTVQLMALTSENSRQNFIDMLAEERYSREAENLFIFDNDSESDTILIFYGEYRTLESARLAVSSLPEFLKKFKPYALSIKEAMAKMER
jgi:type II secretory pathway predicted ATPase ExeA/septal ring-binding cell division protein DamX